MTHIRLVTVDGEQVAKPPRRSRDRDKRNMREVYLWMAENHLADMEKALLALTYHMATQRLYLEDLKGLDGFRYPAKGQSMCFSDHSFFEENELKLIPKPKKRKQ